MISDTTPDQDGIEDDDDLKSIPPKLIQYKSWVWYYGKLFFKIEKGKK